MEVIVYQISTQLQIIMDIMDTPSSSQNIVGFINNIFGIRIG